MSETPQTLSRRTVLKGAAWSAPVVAAAVAVPMASASVNNADLYWSDSDTGLLSLRLLDGSSVLTAQALVTVPTAFTIENGPGAITEAASITVTVGRPGGINLPLGRARGFGVYAAAGQVTAPAERSISYQRTPLTGIQYGFPITTWTGTRTVSIDSNGSLAVPVEFGLAGNSDLLSISALASFPVSLSVTLGGVTYTDSTSISVPVGAGLL
ncbi:hypothetical protein [Microbacterium sp. YY-01]|uniref:hypothetical protein n=1 Tax=Microbacterium sp. YY-01 TaxID=3421634 RepID=UPI003D16BC68